MSAASTAHRFDAIEDRCTCGGMVVYFDDPDNYGFRGEGCEMDGVWESNRISDEERYES